MREKILCYHHNDMDGKSAGAVVAHYFGIEDDTNFHEVNYDGNLPNIENARDFDCVIFVDYSFTEKTCHVLKDLIKKDVKIIWIDHHGSSVNLIEKHPEFANSDNIDGVVQEGISGAALAYMFFNRVDYDDIPYFLKLVSDYDCWKNEMLPQSTYFKLGVDTYDYGPFSDLWKDLFESNNDPKLIKDICNTGKIIKEYIDRDHAAALATDSYESEIDGHKCLCINKRGNSWIFGDRINDYPLVCAWQYNGKQYTYSLYSHEKGIDVSKIAENHGGGGHPHASGFMSKQLILK